MFIMPTVRQIKGYQPNETNQQLTAAETFTGEDNTVARSCNVYTSSAILTAFTVSPKTERFYGDLIWLATITRI